MSTDTPVADATPAADAAATDLLDAPAADAAAPVTDDKGATPTESKLDAKASGDDGKGSVAPDLLADDDEGTPDKKADGPADADADKAPETYEAFTLPDGVEIDEGLLAKATPVFKSIGEGLKQEDAQKLVSFFAEAQAEAAAQQVAAFNKIKSDWAAELKADAEFGGENLSKTVGATKALIGKFGSPQLLAELKEWGWGNNPELNRFCARINAALSPDTTVIADAAHQSTPKSAAEVLWPGMFQKQE